MNKLLTSAAAIAAIAAAHPAHAATSPQPGDPVTIGEGLTLDPIVDGRLRWEHVDTPALDADAVTLRLRAGAELRHASGLALLAEAEGTLALADSYNAFAFPIADSQRRPGHAVVADPMSAELNRLQLQYRSKPLTLTLGRQRSNLDDQRFGRLAPERADLRCPARRGRARPRQPRRHLRDQPAHRVRQ